jgi:hypothetical protein
MKLRYFVLILASWGILFPAHLPSQAARPSSTASPSNAALISAGYVPPSIRVGPGKSGKANVTFTFTPTDRTIVKVALAGTFNNWHQTSLPMAQAGNSFQRVVELPYGVHEYKFVTTNNAGQTVWKDDPQNRLNTDDLNGGRNSLLIINAPGGGSGAGNNPANRGEPIRWQIDVATAQREAVQTGKGVLVFFSSSSATASRFIEDNIFTDGRVRDLVTKNFVPLRIDMQLQADLARRMGVPRGGVIAIYDKGGSRVIGVVDRPDSADQLLMKVQEFIKASGTVQPASPATNVNQPRSRP